MSNQHLYHNERQISSSEDHCRCQACRNQEELKNHQRNNLTHIYMFKHLKKRGAPPIKKQTGNKDFSQKAKQTNKKQQIEKRLDTQKMVATPNKHKLIQVLKTKQIQNPSFFIDYHQVSHSQRQKVPSRQAMTHMIQQPRRQINQEDLRNHGLNKQLRPRIQSIKLIQISENPQNIKIRYHHSRSMSQASANHNEHMQNNYKSIDRKNNI